MVFSSSVFLLLFMPVVLIAYFALPWRAAKNVWLLMASLVLYAWGEPVYVFLMMTSIVVNWLLALRIGDGAANTRKALLVTAVVFNVAVIGVFKYQGFVADSVNALLGISVLSNYQLPLPIGISFYTLQALSYVIDVYRKEVEPQRNLLFLGMYVACFPQLIAGPIVRYQTIQEQVVGRKETISKFSDGMRLFIVGLAKKVLLANTVALLATKLLAMGGPHIGAVGAWAGLIAYTFQIFFDFSGYSDMAIGLGRMMGFTYLRNFNYPYISRSVTEFWRRWHISLSTFFRDYVYIPLGGSRVAPARHIFNIATVWAITGLWHGAAWNYVLWGVYYGILLICEKYLWGNLIARTPSPMQHFYTILVFVFGWSFFWITDPQQLVPYWRALIGMYGMTGDSSTWALMAWSYWPVFAVCAVASTPMCPFVKEHIIAWIESRPAQSVVEHGIAHVRTLSTKGLCTFEAVAASTGKRVTFYAFGIVYDVALLVLLGLCIMSVVSGSFNPFIYFQF